MPNPQLPGWKITMLLADHAQSVLGKLYLAGGGWSVTGPGPVTMGIAAKIDVPWDAANKKYEFLLQLLDSDGQQVQLPGPSGPQPFVIRGPFEVGRPVGIKPGTPLDVSFALNVGPLPLPPGRFEVRLEVEGQAYSTCAFTVREPQPPPPPQIVVQMPRPPQA